MKNPSDPGRKRPTFSGKCQSGPSPGPPGGRGRRTNKKASLSTSGKSDAVGSDVVHVFGGGVRTGVSVVDTRPTGGGSARPTTLCYEIMLEGRKSIFRAGFRPDSDRKVLTIGPPTGRKPAEGLILRVSKSGPEERFPAQKHY